MKRFIVVLLSVIAVVFVGSARAALVYDGYATGPGGLSTPYPSGTPAVYAGLLEMSSGSGTILTMSDDRTTLSHSGDSWSMTIYTYDEVMHGAPVRFTPAQYARAAVSLSLFFPPSPLTATFPDFSLRQLAEVVVGWGHWGANRGNYEVNDFLAQMNVDVWDIMSSPSCPTTPYPYGCSGVDTFNWSQTMWVATPNGPGGDERLIIIPGQNIVLGSSTLGPLGPIVPLPPAAWLLGSGLLGLATVARQSRRVGTSLCPRG